MMSGFTFAVPMAAYVDLVGNSVVASMMWEPASPMGPYMLYRRSVSLAICVGRYREGVSPAITAPYIKDLAPLPLLAHIPYCFHVGHLKIHSSRSRPRWFPALSMHWSHIDVGNFRLQLLF